MTASKPHSDLLARAAREPLGVDISDYSDEFCDGFLRGQVNALEESGLLEQLEVAQYEREAWRTTATEQLNEGLRLKEQLEATERVVKAAKLLVRRDTFDMRIVQVREDNLLDALRAYNEDTNPAKRPS